MNGKPQQPFPKPLQHAEEEIGKFWEACHMLCNKILQLLAVSLKVNSLLLCILKRFNLVLDTQ